MENGMKERKDIAVTVRLFSSMNMAIKIVSEQMVTSPSWIIRRAIRDYLIANHPDAIQKATEVTNEKEEE